MILLMMSVTIIKGCFSSTSTGTTPKPVVTTTPKPQAPKPSPPVTVPNTNNGTSLVIVPSFANPKPINQNIISFNTGFMFSSPMEKEPEVAVITKTLSPKVLRFPGGTIGNYYHPDGIGYGMKKEETGNTLSDLVKAQPLFKQNAIHHFADLCRMSGSKVIYVANMLTGNTNEMIWVLDYFKKAGIEVIAVELGNEFYFRVYREQYPDVTAYIQQAKTYAAVLRKYNPAIKIAVVAADPTDQNAKGEGAVFLRSWNELLGKESFYDVYVPHLYPKVKACEDKSGDNLPEVFDCIDFTLATEYFNYHQIIMDYYKQFFPGKKMWVTEWNVDAANTTANTMRHAEFVAEFLMGLIDANIASNNLIEYAFFHNYGSGGYAAPIFSLTFPGVQYLRSSGKIAYNTTYYPFYYLTRLLYTGARRTSETIQFPKGMDSRQMVAKTFIDPTGKKAYVYFINKTSDAVPLFLQQPQAKAVQMSVLSGKYPWSVAGMNGFYKKLPQMVDLVTEKTIPLSETSVSMPANSVGYVEYVLQ